MNSASRAEPLRFPAFLIVFYTILTLPSGVNF